MKLQHVIDQYITLRRSLGSSFPGLALLTFGRALGGTNIKSLRTKQVEAFLVGTGPITLTYHIKLGALRPFFQYAISRGYLVTAPLPVRIPKRPPPFVPYIYSHDELRRLLHEVDSDCRRRTCLEPITIRTILLLLYGAGLRLQEALKLTRGDVNLDDSLLTVRQTKFGKTRLVPIGPQLGRVLTRYISRTPRRSDGAGIESPFFTSRTGTPVPADTLEHNFRYFCDRAAIRRTDSLRFQPRLHDLRHTFAVHRLTSWYQQGADVQRLLPLLSVYLGHVCLRHTQVYLSMTPELLQQASQRFEIYVEKEKHDKLSA